MSIEYFKLMFSGIKDAIFQTPGLSLTICFMVAYVLGLGTERELENRRKRNGHR